MIYRLFIVVVFIAIIVGSVLLGGQQREAVSPTTVDEKAGDLGYAARQAKLVETGADGRPLYTITADLIREPPKSSTVELQQVQMRFRDTTGNEWNGRADNGELGQDTGKVQLAGNVQIWGLAPGSRDTASIATEKLSIDTREDMVNTEDPVTLVWTGRQIHSKGLAANLKDRVVHLQSSVHGTSAP